MLDFIAVISFRKAAESILVLQARTDFQVR